MAGKTGFRTNRLRYAQAVALVTAVIASYPAGGALAATSSRSDATTVTVTFTAKRFSVSRPGAPQP